MGIYLAPTSAVLAHRLHHSRGEPAPETINWQLTIPLIQHPVTPQAENNAIQVDPPPLDPATTEDLVELLHQPDSDFDSNQGICSFCVSEFLQENQDSEAAANAILKGLVPSLETIQWMGWFTPKHLGVNQYFL
jgi:hypothetical protein